jgi:hypothetical protein
MTDTHFKNRAQDVQRNALPDLRGFREGLLLLVDGEEFLELVLDLSERHLDTEGRTRGAARRRGGGVVRTRCGRHGKAGRAL